MAEESKVVGSVGVGAKTVSPLAGADYVLFVDSVEQGKMMRAAIAGEIAKLAKKPTVTTVLTLDTLPAGAKVVCAVWGRLRTEKTDGSGLWADLDVPMFGKLADAFDVNSVQSSIPQPEDGFRFVAQLRGVDRTNRLYSRGTIHLVLG